jgi:hypothetical protein
MSMKTYEDHYSEEGAVVVPVDSEEKAGSDRVQQHFNSY